MPLLVLKINETENIFVVSIEDANPDQDMDGVDDSEDAYKNDMTKKYKIQDPSKVLPVHNGLILWLDGQYPLGVNESDIPSQGESTILWLDHSGKETHYKSRNTNEGLIFGENSQNGKNMMYFNGTGFMFSESAYEIGSNYAVFFLLNSQVDRTDLFVSYSAGQKTWPHIMFERSGFWANAQGDGGRDFNIYSETEKPEPEPEKPKTYNIYGEFE